MTDISDLERRITSALDRIGRGMDALAAEPSKDDGSQIKTLNQSLNEERAANEQLGEKLRALKEKHVTVVGQFESQLEDITKRLAEREAELKSLKADRTKQIAEMDKILKDLKPLVGETLNA